MRAPDVLTAVATPKPATAASSLVPEELSSGSARKPPSATRASAEWIRCGAGTGRATHRCMERIRIEQHSWTGTVWAFGWLFTIGYLHLTFWKAVLALLLWPYYLGVMLSGLR